MVDILFFTDGITMVGFQRLGTVRGFKFEHRPLPMVKDRTRSGSDPLHLYSSSSDENVGSPEYDEFNNCITMYNHSNTFFRLLSMDLVAPQSAGLTRSHGCLYEPNDNHRDSSQYVGFEQMWQNNSYHLEVRFRFNLRPMND